MSYFSFSRESKCFLLHEKNVFAIDTLRFCSFFSFFFTNDTPFDCQIFLQILPAGRLHRGRDGHHLSAVGGGDASFMVATGLSRYPGADCAGYLGVLGGAAGFRRHSFYRHQPTVAD